MSIVLLILGLLLFIGLVVLHEFGHFLAARRNGVDVEEFGVGFPPAAWKRKTKKGFIFSINWLPIGGFVRLKGENDAATEKGSFGAASFKTKAKIMLAGVAMNLLAAFVILTALAWIGMPQLIPKQFAVKSDTHYIRQEVLVTYMEAGSPADKAGLRLHDKLITIQGTGKSDVPITVSADALPRLTKHFAGQTAHVVYERDGVRHTATAQLRPQQPGKNGGYLGIDTGEMALTRAGWSAPVQAVGLMTQVTDLTFRGMGTAIAALFHGQGAKASEQVSGPVGIVAVLKGSSTLGIQYVLLIIGIISLSLAIMNVLPIPALDGGRFYVMALSRVFKKKLSQQAEERIVGSSFAFLLALIVLITVVDVKRFF
jgi:regulator of sigma E protease